MVDILRAWFDRWNIPAQARAEFQLLYIRDCATRPSHGDDSEAAASARCRADAARDGVVLWRNNNGMAHTPGGGVVRFGLCNDSAAMNKRIKSPDLVGIRPVRIEPHHVGSIIGQFTGREIKRPGWVYRGTPRERAQRAFHLLAGSLGADSGFATGWGHAE